MIQLYNDLMNLCDNHEAFFYVDQDLDGRTFRIFNYRLGSYSQWLLPAALECRGITFEITDRCEPVRIASRPFEKFFNLHENPFTMDLDLDDVIEIQEKADGSLISSMLTVDVTEDKDTKLWLKSKGSLNSDQALAAMDYIRGNSDLHDFVFGETANDKTVIMEYVAPDNRIVLHYDEPRLIILGIRNNNTGEYYDLDTYLNDYEMDDYHPDTLNHMVTLYGTDNAREFIESVPAQQGIEGFVCRLKSGQRFKVKTEWYLKLHHIKDSINSQRRLFEAVVYETSDDIKASFYDDPAAIALVEEMEEKVSAIYNHMVDTVERFVRDNHTLERKDFAIKGQAELSKLHFGLAMRKYLGHEVDFKEAMVKHRKDFGIKDDPNPADQEVVDN